ncbi:hypothetical protein GCM10027425_19400 [Alteromonas gracilis]
MSEDVDAYLDRFEGETRERLDTLRALLHQQVPDAGERISYGIPTLTRGGRNVVHFAGYAAHCAIYPVPEGDAAFLEEAAAYRSGRGTIRLPHDRPLPIGLIERAAALLAERAG